MVTMGVALAMVPVVMFPVLKRQNKALALGYVVFRALEATTYIAAALADPVLGLGTRSPV